MTEHGKTSIIQVGTVGVPATDQDRTLAFYTDVLGLEKVRDLPFGQGQRWIEVMPAGGGTSIAITPVGTSPVGVDTGIRLTRDDADADHAALGPTTSTWTPRSSGTRACRRCSRCATQTATRSTSSSGCDPSGDRRPQAFGWTTASTFRLGSMNQAAQEWPISAIPSTVTGSGAAYSSIRTPRALRSARAAWMSGTRQAIWVWVSAVPTVLCGDDELGPVAAPEDDPIVGSSRWTSRPSSVVIEGLAGARSATGGSGTPGGRSGHPSGRDFMLRPDLPATRSLLRRAEGMSLAVGRDSGTPARCPPPIRRRDRSCDGAAEA